jgi:cystathionine beta-lyase
MNDFLSRRIPRVKLIKPEGTYLVWLDFSGLGLGEDELEELIVKKARLWLDKGTMFGKGGSGFQRVNIACPRSVLEEALLRLEKAVNG